MIDVAKFRPRTVYVTYIASTPERVWQALIDPAFTAQYFFGRTAEIAPKAGGSFVMRMPDGRVDIKGEVVEWSTTWTVDWDTDMRELPPCLVSCDIEPAGDNVKLTMTESYSWDVPEALLAGGRAGWPAILSSLKSVLETGKPLSIKMEPPREMMAALQQVFAAKPWLSCDL